jgi:hypothetical protein
LRPQGAGQRHRSLLRRAVVRHRHVARAEDPVPVVASDSTHALVLWGAVRGLATRQRAVVVLRFQEGLSEVEVARLLQLPLGTIKSPSSSSGNPMLRKYEHQSSNPRADPSVCLPIPWSRNCIIRSASAQSTVKVLFVYLHILWFGVWILSGAEQYPYGLLTMIVSLEAIFLSTFVMISQNRADEKRQVLADHQWQTVQEEEQQNQELLALSNQILELTRAIHALDTARSLAGRRPVDYRAGARPMSAGQPDRPALAFVQRFTCYRLLRCPSGHSVAAA